MKITISAFLLLTVFQLLGFSQESIRYQLPPQEIIEMVDAPATPSISFSPDSKIALLLHRAEMPGISELAAPEARLAGVRINPDNFGPSRVAGFTGIEILRFDGDKPIRVQGLPAPCRIRNVRWSANGQFAAFSLDHNNRIELWILDLNSSMARKLSSRAVNDVIGNAFTWFEPNKSIVFASVIADPAQKPVASPVPLGPEVQESLGKQAAVRTFQDLLRDQYDAELFEHFIKTQLVVVDIQTGHESTLGKPGLISRFSPSPDARWLLIQELKKPFSYAVPWMRFATRVELWDLSGRVIRTIADLPVAENIPQGANAVRTGPRSFEWQSDAPATLWWAEALDGGDPAVKVPFRDQLFMLQAPFTSDPLTGPKTELRFSGIIWGNKNLAVLFQSWRQTRRAVTMFFKPSVPTELPRLVFDLSTEDRYGDPGNFYTTTNASGQQVLLFDSKQKFLYLTGAGNSPEGSFPFIARFDLNKFTSERLWQCKAPFYEYVSTILTTEPLQFITRKEARDMQPNFYLHDFRKKTTKAITNLPDPFPRLQDIEKMTVHYKRSDGVALNGELYLPPGYKMGEKQLPTIIWAYPREFKSADGAGQVTGSPYTFTRLGATSIVMMATQGYAVLNNASFPIVGEGDAEPNDTFIPQLIANAQAAIRKLYEMGVADTNRMAVAGHSYGAYMVANLLSHSNLFAAGLARSGAYNRSLTPFGFQSEERTYWQAPEVYNVMSPFNYAHQMKTPILLTHGADDNNAGTFPIQSERYFQALRGLGVNVRLVILPFESHGYSARESVLHVQWETLKWLDKYVKNK